MPTLLARARTGAGLDHGQCAKTGAADQRLRQPDGVGIGLAYHVLLPISQNAHRVKLIFLLRLSANQPGFDKGLDLAFRNAVARQHCRRLALVFRRRGGRRRLRARKAWRRRRALEHARLHKGISSAIVRMIPGFPSDSTGATQASVCAKRAVHSSRVFSLTRSAMAARICGHNVVSYWLAYKTLVERQQFCEFGEEVRFKAADGEVLSVRRLVGVVEGRAAESSRFTPRCHSTDPRP